jgi:hypothetical protein
MIKKSQGTRGGVSDSADSPFLFSITIKERYNVTLKEASTTPTKFPVEKNQTTDGEPRKNLSILQQRQSPYAPWSGRNWKDFYINISRIK